jgi:hypothetical protein
MNCSDLERSFSQRTRGKSKSSTTEAPVNNGWPGQQSSALSADSARDTSCIFPFALGCQNMRKEFLA